MDIHDPNNWAAMACDDGETYLLFAGAPVDQEGEVYPPVNLALVVAGAALIGEKLKRSDIAGCVGAIWNVLRQYYDGEYDDNYPLLGVVEEIACQMHQHLGPLYDDFILTREELEAA